jgi:hypothetical protein
MTIAYINEIRLSDQLRSDRLAKLCRVDSAAHNAEVQTAIGDILRASEKEEFGFEVEVPFLARIPGQRGRLVLSVSVDASTRSIVWEFSDAPTGEILDTTVTRFSKIRSVMDPYRQIVEKLPYPCRFNELDTVSHGDLLRKEIHYELLQRMGFNVDPEGEKKNDLSLEVELGRYIGNLIYALFPKGPADDWTWQD